MTEKLDRKVMKIYGENAAARDIIAYGSDIAGDIVQTKDPNEIQNSAYVNGVRDAIIGQNSTTLQNRQTLDYLFSRQLKYIYQNGIPEWGADETYYQFSVVRGSDGNLYCSITDNNVGNNPVEDTLHTNWRNFPTYAELEAKVNKAGDTMSGQLVMENGSNGIRFNGSTSDNFYYINQEAGSQYLTLYHKNGKGLLINGNQNGMPYYYDGTNYYRILNTNDISSIDYVVEYVINDQGGWYRKYKSGWVEQGANNAQVKQNIPLYIPYANTEYQVLITYTTGNRENSKNHTKVQNRTTTYFNVDLYDDAKFSWVAFGQANI